MTAWHRDQEQLVFYCPWCDHCSIDLRNVHQHMDVEHDFLKGTRPPDDPRYTIDGPTEGLGLW